jgi:hypothetical protein
MRIETIHDQQVATVMDETSNCRILNVVFLTPQVTGFHVIGGGVNCPRNAGRWDRCVNVGITLSFCTVRNVKK